MAIPEALLSIFAMILAPSGDIQFPAAYRRPELTEQFVEVVSHPGDNQARIRLIGMLEEAGLPFEASFVRRSLNVGHDSHDPSVPRDFREKIEASERQYSVLCSLHHGVSREESQKRLDDARAESKVLAHDSVSNPCQVRRSAETSIDGIGFECPLVAEWAYATIPCYLSGEAEVEKDLELAYRSLLELELRGYMPNATPTSTDLLFFMARATSHIGDQKLAIVLATSALQDYPSDEEASSLRLLAPRVSRQEIEDFIAKARSATEANQIEEDPT
jgi:hypothetical protein